MKASLRDGMTAVLPWYYLRRSAAGEGVIDRVKRRLLLKEGIPWQRLPKTRECARNPRILVGEAPHRHELADFDLDARGNDVVIVLRLRRETHRGRRRRHAHIELGDVHLDAERDEPRDVRAKCRRHAVEDEV